jgi:hypothetical protein
VENLPPTSNGSGQTSSGAGPAGLRSEESSPSGKVVKKRTSRKFNFEDLQEFAKLLLTYGPFIAASLKKLFWLFRKKR